MRPQHWTLWICSGSLWGPLTLTAPLLWLPFLTPETLMVREPVAVCSWTLTPCSLLWPSRPPSLSLHLWTIYCVPLHQHTFTPTSDRPQGPRSQPLSNLCPTVLRGHVPVRVVYVGAADKALEVWLWTFTFTELWGPAWCKPKKKPVMKVFQSRKWR